MDRDVTVLQNDRFRSIWIQGGLMGICIYQAAYGLLCFSLAMTTGIRVNIAVAFLFIGG